jgi:hypothetical protein
MNPLFDQMLYGLNLNTGVAGYTNVGSCATITGSTAPGTDGCATGQVRTRGSAAIRRAFGANLANGNYVGVINSLLGANTAVGIQPLPIDPLTGTTLQTAQRALRNGCDRLANNLTQTFVDGTTGQTIGPRCFSENYFTANRSGARPCIPPIWVPAIYKLPGSAD